MKSFFHLASLISQPCFECRTCVATSIVVHRVSWTPRANTRRGTVHEAIVHALSPHDHTNLKRLVYRRPNHQSEDAWSYCSTQQLRLRKSTSKLSDAAGRTHTYTRRMCSQSDTTSCFGLIRKSSLGEDSTYLPLKSQEHGFVESLFGKNPKHLFLVLSGKSPLRGNHLRVGENAKLSAGVEGKNPQAAAQQNVTPIPTCRCRRASRVRAASSFASSLKASLLTQSSLSLFHHNINQHNSALHHTSPLVCLLHLTIRLHQPINIIISEHAAHLTTTLQPT
jgi:hypothetical protein